MREVMLVLPGASLMEITPLADGVRVRCPGCGNEEEYRGTGDRRFMHEADCSVHQQIARAMRLYVRDVVRHG